MGRPNSRQQPLFPDELFPPRVERYLCLDTEAYRSSGSIVHATEDRCDDGTFRTRAAVSRAQALSNWIFAKHGSSGMGRWYHSGRYVMVTIAEWQDVLAMEKRAQREAIARVFDRYRIHRAPSVVARSGGPAPWQQSLSLK